MNAVDPLIYAQRLTAAGVPAEQAQIHAEIIREVLASMAIDRLESKVDKGLAELNNKIDNGLAELNTKIDNGLAELNTKIDSGLAELNTKIDRTKAELEARMDRLISDLRKELMAEIQKSKWSCVRWMFGIAVSVGTLQGAAIVMAMRWLA
ncbi:hypothetical protein [Pseudoduganella sp. R-43]|uniref:hypothetical protein n=1 Tax=unclassified Pseudoduganella TaxID=2637179 RepID=UPI003CED3966